MIIIVLVKHEREDKWLKKKDDESETRDTTEVDKSNNLFRQCFSSTLFLMI